MRKLNFYNFRGNRVGILLYVRFFINVLNKVRFSRVSYKYRNFNEI